MPIIFVHGVSNRAEDPSYDQGVRLRRRMAKRLIGPAMHEFPLMADVQHIYWGDLGVKFLWDMASLPTDVTFETVADDVGRIGEGVGLTAFLFENDNTNGSSPLLTAARSKPSELLGYIATTVAEGIRADSLKDSRIDPYFSEFVNLDGTAIADLLINLSDAKSDFRFLERLTAAKSDLEVNDLITDRIAPRDVGGNEFYEEGLKESVGDAWSWVQSKVADANNWVQDKWEKTKTDGARGASVLLLKKTREQFSKKSFLFFGDVFEYIKRGQGANGTIKNRVCDEIKRISNKAGNTTEPLVVISHSFGGEVVYDLLTSGVLEDTPIDLWVTVGSQVGLFAEMSLYDYSKLEKPTYGKIGRPKGVSRWINVYDTVDVFSFLCEPIFGSDAVTDIKIGTGTVASAHGAYFSNPQLYRIIASELQDWRNRE